MNFHSVKSITLSGNSYGTEACRWIADNVLTHCANLERVNFSNIFISRLKEDLPISLKLLMDAVNDKKITHCDLSHNAFGPQGIASFEKFLEGANHLTHLDVSNCGLSPAGGEMIAAALMKNDDMKLQEFAGTRSRLEEEGLTALSGVFKKQHSLVKLDVMQNGSKRGLAPLLESLVDCKDTLKELIINDNKSINRAVPQLIECIKNCHNLEVLNISDLNLKHKYINSVVDAIIESLETNKKLHTLIWNYDLSRSHSAAKSFIQRLS